MILGLVAERTGRTAYDKTCEHCKKAFVGEVATRRFCGKRCAASVKRRPEKTCIGCGARYRTKAEKYCSQACAGKARYGIAAAGSSGKMRRDHPLFGTYIPVLFGTRVEALDERWELLRHMPRGSRWRRRLRLEERAPGWVIIDRR